MWEIVYKLNLKIEKKLNLINRFKVKKSLIKDIFYNLVYLQKLNISSTS